MVVAPVQAFADPVMSATACFRAVLDAMSRPGVVQTVGGISEVRAPLMAGSYAVALTLFDHETLIWLDEPSSVAAVDIRFHCGAAITDDKQLAAFAIVSEPHAIETFGDFAQGTAEYPDRSSTVILQVKSVDRGRPLRLTGPGVNGHIDVAIDGLPEDFLKVWADNSRHAPQGVDLILVAGERILGLPRSTAIVDIGAIGDRSEMSGNDTSSDSAKADHGAKANHGTEANHGKGAH